MRVLKAILIAIMLMVFLAGFAFFTFPFMQNIVTTYYMQQEAQDFFEHFEITHPTEPNATDVPVITVEPTILSREHEALWEDMLEYNRQIWEEKQAGLCDPWAYQQPSFTLGEYGLKEEVFGVITIPALGLEMPLYLGATSEHMANGAAHLSQTSLPIGGMNTNCVIAGHRGFGGADYFRYVTELKPGDEVIITNLWETMVFTVSETKIIMPNEIDQILIQEGRELITLLTCHPYASGGKQRCVIYCDRTP